MIGVRFYLEFPDRKTKKSSGKAHKGHLGNVFAMTSFIPNFVNGTYAGYGGLYETPNSDVALTCASPDVIYQQYKRIPEELARKIHPALFERLRLDDPSC